MKTIDNHLHTRLPSLFGLWRTSWQAGTTSSPQCLLQFGIEKYEVAV